MRANCSSNNSHIVLYMEIPGGVRAGRHSRCPSTELGESGILNTNEMAAMYIICSQD